MGLRLKALFGIVCTEAVLLPLACPAGRALWPALDAPPAAWIGLHFALLAGLVWWLAGAASRQLQAALAERCDGGAAPGADAIDFQGLPPSPAAANPAPAAEASRRVAAIAPSEVTVLLVEDGPANQHVLSAMLRQGGYAVDVAGSGQAAIDAIGRRYYDVVLMDVSMPGMNGMETTRCLRGMGGQGGGVPIIAMTAHAVQGYREQCLAAGMDDFASKPIGKQQLQALVAFWAGRKHGASAAESVSAPAASLVDVPTIQRLAADAGREDDVAGLVRLFLDELAQRRAAIANAAAMADLAVLRHESHALKSEADTFGAAPLQRLAVEVESCCKRGDAAAVAAAQKLLLCADATREEMERQFCAAP